MRIIRVSLAFLFILIIGFILGQKTPGYMGKRFNFQINLQTSPATSSFFELGDFSESLFDVNPRLTFSLEYTIGLQHTPGVYYERTNDYTTIGKAENQVLIDAVVSGNTICIFDKIFKTNNTGSISPHGKYMLVQIAYHNMHLEDGGGFFGPDVTDLGEYRSFSIGWGFGKQMVVWKNLNFNLALKNNYNLAYLKYLLVKSSNNTSPEEHGFNPLNTAVYRKLFADNIINITFGLGWIF